MTDCLTPGRLDELFRPLLAHDRIVLAVSGGADSVALMHLVRDWRKRAPQAAACEVHVATVDHRLRPESGIEAERVGAMCRAAGFERHVTLIWDGPHPSSGIQAAARAARYRLLRDYMSATGITALVTAHTADDQAETVLMRLARGSGIDGLAAMRPATELDQTATLFRPLLAVGKADLVAYLHRIGADWIEDPSNTNDAFERVRWRAARNALHSMGLTNEALATTARRVARARRALNATTARLVAEAGAQVHVSALGYATFDRDWLAAQEDEFRLRILGACIAAFGGEAAPVPLASLELALDRVDGLAPDRVGGFTLHGAQVDWGAGRVVVTRERMGGRGAGQPGPELAPVLLSPGTSLVWDHRFDVALAATASQPFDVSPLGSVGLTELAAAGWRRPAGVPAPALWGVPALRRNGSICAVPQLDFRVTGDDAALVSSTVHRLPFSRRRPE